MVSALRAMVAVRDIRPVVRMVGCVGVRDTVAVRDRPAPLRGDVATVRVGVVVVRGVTVA